MTREEAIAILQEEIDGNLELTLSEWRERDEQKLFPAIRMAIKALQADAVSREAHYDAVANRITDMEERGFVSVVRCKDCRFYWGNLGEDDTDEMYGECRWDSDEMPNADDFCSYAERKEP